MATPQDILAQAVEQHRRRNLAEAERAYREVLRQDPQNVDAHHLLGVVLFETRRTEEALSSLQTALRLNPLFAVAHYNLGRALGELGRFEQASLSYREAIRTRPDFANAHYNLGNLLRDANRPDEAMASFRNAIASDPKHAKSLANLGHLLSKRGDQDAVSCFQRVVALEPTSVVARINLGTALRQTGNLARAADEFGHAVRLDPNSAAAWNELGTVWVDLSKQTDEPTGLREQACTALQRAIELKPDLIESHINLGSVLHESGRFDEAAQSYQRAIALRPDSAEAYFNLGVLSLLRGDLERGWKGYAWRSRSPLEPPNKPRWDGSSPAGKTVLLYPEQGMGDIIQFIRFASVLKDRGARVLFGCPAPLLRLLGSCRGIDLLLPDRSPLPAFDCFVPLLNLPGLLGINLENIPAGVPYLSAPDELVRSWRSKLAHLSGLRVGIAWQGNPKHQGDRQRSICLQQLESLGRIEGVHLVSLQQGVGADQIAAMNDRFPIYDPGTLSDFLETAATMRSLDLIVTVDTSVAHLAGALGLPTWVLLPAVPDWRWLLNRNDSPWYPTMRLFRQERSGDWTPMIQQVTDELKQQAIRFDPARMQPK